MEIKKSTLEQLKEVGRKSQTYDELIRHRFKCNSSDCERVGSIEIGIPAGTAGTVTLFVCPNCVGRF